MTQSRSEGKTLGNWNLNPPLDTASHEVQEFESGSKNKLSASIHIEVGKGVTGSKRVVVRPPGQRKKKPVPTRRQVINTMSPEAHELLAQQLRGLVDGQQPTVPTKGGLD
jgi:hypothetical protein